MNQNYESEVHQRWGETDAYGEYKEKTKNYSKETWFAASDGLMAIFAEFSACKARGEVPGSETTQALVAKLQAYITENYYTCTDEILAGLGKMYVADERFKKNIDKCGKETADFVSAAIARFCKGR